MTLSIPAGESLALVGENGAGKTTLVKLLTRLYEPTEGRILLDGRDLRAWDVADLRRRFGVLFQDFNQYQLKVRENVGMGSVEHLDDEPRIERAVESGGAREVVSALKEGLEAPLGRWFQNGTELSGGQWQKIALARAFMREEADILVLDEPTASLDAEAEHAVFTRFRTLAQGRTTIVISHRFPTVRMAAHDHRPGPRRDRGARHPRGAGGAGGAVRPDVRPPGRGVPLILVRPRPGTPTAAPIGSNVTIARRADT